MTRLLLNYEASAFVYQAVHENGLKNGVLALFDFGDKAGELDRAPSGNNMTYRKKMFEKHRWFSNPTLAPNPEARLKAKQRSSAPFSEGKLSSQTALT
jgi:hypothetical protein